MSPRWSLVPLGELCEVNIGRTPSRAESAYWGPGAPWVSIADMNQGRDIRSTKETITERAVRECNCRPVQAGTVLLSFKLSIGKVGVSRMPLYTNEAIASLPIRNASQLDTGFLYWALKAADLTAGLDRAAKGLTLNKPKLLAIELPVPPIGEQRRIAEVLDRADVLRARREMAVEALDGLAAATFHHLFGGVRANPKGWRVLPIGQVTECLDRLRKPVKASERSAGDVPYYGANGQQGWIDRALFDEPLVLVAEDGGHFDEPSRGVAYRIDGPAWVNNHAHVLRARPDMLETEYLHRVLRHYDFSPYISGTTRAKLTQAQLNAAEIPVPPLLLQRQFASTVGRMEGVRQTAIAAKRESTALCTALQQRAFAGEL